MLTPAEIDPLFDEFSKIGSPDAPDPRPALAAMRAQGPVHTIEVFGAKAALVLGYDALSEVFRDGRRFSSAGYAKSVGLLFGHSILEMDPPEHTGYRSLAQQAFTRRSLEAWRETLLVPYLNQFVDAFVARGRADLSRELAFPFPLEMIAGMLDLPALDRLRYFRWSVDILAGHQEGSVAQDASKQLGEYFAPRIQAARGRSGEDLVTRLANVELEGRQLTTDEILPFIRLLSPAAFETTARAFSNLMCCLLTQPEQLEAVRADRKLIGPAVQEGLRCEPPLLAFGRTATSDTQLAGFAIAEGQPVVCMVGAANQDATRWDDPARFDLRRAPKPHLAFAQGPHTCLGMHLALMELETALAVVLDRLPNLRLDPQAPAPHITGGSFRAALSLPVTFDAVRGPSRSRVRLEEDS